MMAVFVLKNCISIRTFGKNKNYGKRAKRRLYRNHRKR